jgi:flavin reductase (DIM6/NTAB) family NADH-FMN oxidoreductase RutF
VTAPEPGGGQLLLGTLVAPDDLRRLLRQHATTVTVVTTVVDQAPVGFTATSFTSVSLRPPLFSFCLYRGSSSWPAVAVAEHVAVHLLAANQTDVARTFATRGIDRFAPTRWRIVLAELLAAEYAEGRPLLYHNGQYRALT